jgi:hypothetical protein
MVPAFNPVEQSFCKWTVAVTSIDCSGCWISDKPCMCAPLSIGKPF